MITPLVYVKTPGIIPSCTMLLVNPLLLGSPQVPWRMLLKLNGHGLGVIVRNTVLKA